MRKSTNYELNLLDEDDFYNEELFNENTEKIDEVMKSLDTPEYDISLQKDVEQLSSGESLRVALRKIAKAVKTLIEHLANKENPHGVSAKDVGLGEVTNESKETMFTNPTFTGTTNAEGYGFGDNAVHPTKVTPYEREYDNTGTTYKTTMVGINAGLHLDGDLEAANFQGLASNFTTENWKMGAAAPLVKQLYEENQSLKEEISTLNSNNYTWLEAGRDGRNIFPQPNGIGFYRVKTSVEAPAESLREYFVISMNDGVDWIVQYWFDTWCDDDYHIWVRKCNINETTAGSWTWHAFKQII